MNFLKDLTGEERAWRILLVIAIFAAGTLSPSPLAALQAAVCAFSLGWRIATGRGKLQQ